MDKRSLASDAGEIEEVLTRGVEQILPLKQGLAELMGKKKITLYQGFDPSMPNLHLGNLVGLMKLRQFQKLGHKLIFLVGDFTGMIGDPTDKVTARKQLTRKEVENNSKNWISQIKNILDFEGDNKVEIKKNSEWSDRITFKDLIQISSNFTVQQLIERDMYQERIKKNEPIYMHEFLYPIAQGYDSVEMNVDLEIGGSDQMFNMLAGRTLMKALKNKEKFVLTTKLLVDKEGKKVGKTTGNALFLDSKPEDFYAGIMSFPDEVIALGFELLTEVDLSGINEKVKSDPMGQKKLLAFEVVKILWGENAANEAKEYFEKTFQKGEPNYNKTAIIQKSLTYTIARELGSNSEAKRIIRQGGVDVNNETIENPAHKVKVGDNIKVGEKIFLKVVNK